MNSTEKHVWVVIPTFNRGEDLVKCLDSLSIAGINMDQIVVIDNASQDNTVSQMEKHYPHLTLIKMERNMGATGGSNVGFNYALNHGAKYVIRMDSDVVVDPDFLAPLVEVAESDPEIGIIGPKIYYFDKPKEIWYAGVNAKDQLYNLTDGYLHAFDTPENSHLRQVDYVWGATMMIRRDVLERTGGFDTDFFVYYEEIDFCDRAKALGYKMMFVPNSFIWHKVGSESNNSWTAYQWNKSKMIFFRKHARGFLQKLYFIVYTFLYAFGDSLLNALNLRHKVGNRGPLKDTLKGLWDGLTMPLTKPQGMK